MPRDIALLNAGAVMADASLNRLQTTWLPLEHHLQQPRPSVSSGFRQM
jgi:hypothetical protein